MALPKLTTPEYTLVVPSTGKEIKYRPFLVKEEKILLIAMEGEDEKQINNAVMNLVKECTFGAISDLKTPVFDVEYIFLKIRSKSVGEIITLSILCPDDEKTRVSYKLNLDEVEVQMSDDHTNIVELTDEIEGKDVKITWKSTFQVSNFSEYCTVVLKKDYEKMIKSRMAAKGLKNNRRSEERRVGKECRSRCAPEQ